MRTIFIGAGHGSGDSGAVSADGKLKEADLALRLRDTVAQHLRARGVSVKTDGPVGQNDPLRNSIAIAQTCQIAVEIHFNAGPATASGVEALSRTQEKALAQKLAQGCAAATRAHLRGEMGWKDQAGGGQHHRLGFCADAHGVVLEVAFISNPAEMGKYLANESQVAQAIASVLAEAAA